MPYFRRERGGVIWFLFMNTKDNFQFLELFLLLPLCQTAGEHPETIEQYLHGWTLGCGQCSVREVYKICCWMAGFPCRNWIVLSHNEMCTWYVHLSHDTYALDTHLPLGKFWNHIEKTAWGWWLQRQMLYHPRCSTSLQRQPRVYPLSFSHLTVFSVHKWVWVLFGSLPQRNEKKRSIILGTSGYLYAEGKGTSYKQIQIMGKTENERGV